MSGSDSYTNSAPPLGFDQAWIDDQLKNGSGTDLLAAQLLSQRSYDKWTGQGAGTILDNARAMVSKLSEAGIERLEDFGRRAVQEPRVYTPETRYVQWLGSSNKPKNPNNSVLPERDPENGEVLGYYEIAPTGRWFETIVIVDGEGGGVQYNEYLSPEKISEFKLSGVEPVSVMQDTDRTEYFNKKTGKVINPDYAFAGGDVWSGTFAGDGRTSFGVQFNDVGMPIFYTQYGGSSSDWGKIAPLLTMASFIPGIAPFAMAINAAASAYQGNYTGAVLSALGAAGGFGADFFSPETLAAIKTTRQVVGVLNAIEKKDFGSFIGSLADVAPAVGITIPVDIIKPLNAAATVSALSKGDWAGALNSASMFIDNPAFKKDIKLAERTANLVSAIESKNPSAIMSAAVGLSRTIDAGSRVVKDIARQTGAPMSDAEANRILLSDDPDQQVKDYYAEVNKIKKEYKTNFGEDLTDDQLQSFADFGSLKGGYENFVANRPIEKVLADSGLVKEDLSQDEVDQLRADLGLPPEPKKDSGTQYAGVDTGIVSDAGGGGAPDTSRIFTTPDERITGTKIRDDGSKSFTINRVNPNDPSESITYEAILDPDTGEVHYEWGGIEFDENGNPTLGSTSASASKPSWTWGLPEGAGTPKVEEPPKVDEPDLGLDLESIFAGVDSGKAPAPTFTLPPELAPTPEPEQPVAEQPEPTDLDTEQPVAPTEPTFPDEPVAPTEPFEPTPEQPVLTTPTEPATPPSGGVNAADVQKIIEDALAQNPSITADDVQAIVRDAVNTIPNLTADQVREIVGTELQTLPAGVTPEGLDEAIIGVKSNVDETRKALEDAIRAAQDIGLEGDAALQAAIDSVAAQQQTNASDILSRLGNTEQALRDEFATEISDLEETTRNQYNALTDVQRAMADTLANQGVTLADAIAVAKEQTQTQIDELSEDVQAKFNSLTDDQKALANDLQQQGVDLNTAIETAKTQTQEQITNLGVEVDARINQLMQQGQTYQQATQQAFTEVNAKNRQLSDLIGTQGRTASQSDIDALSEMLGGRRSMDLSYDVTGDKQITQDDIDFLTGVVSGQNTGWTAPQQSPWAATGLYGQIQANELQRQKDLADAEARRVADQQAAARAASERERRESVQTNAARGQASAQDMLQQIQSMQRAAMTPQPVQVVESSAGFDLSNPLNTGFFSGFQSKKTQQNQQPTTKIATGGYIDDLLAENMTVDDLLNLLR